jgi:hypothetical protein
MFGRSFMMLLASYIKKNCILIALNIEASVILCYLNWGVDSIYIYKNIL